MDIKLELLQGAICDAIKNNIEKINIDADKIVDTKSTKLLSEIKKIINNDTLTDFEMVESIVELFEKNSIYCGGCHDF